MRGVYKPVNPPHSSGLDAGFPRGRVGETLVSQDKGGPVIMNSEIPIPRPTSHVPRPTGVSS
jgi:hypothetical protein